MASPAKAVRRPALRVCGPVFALLTPFEDGTLRVDYEALGAYCAWLQERGVQNVIANGTTAEFASLAPAERAKVLEFVRERFQPGVVIAHVSACSVEEATDAVEHAARTGVDAALVLPPFYYAGADESGVEAFLREVVRACEAIALPVFLYHFPKHAGNAITPETYGRLCDEFQNVAGIKDSGGDLDASKAFQKAAPNRQVIVGNDRKALEVLRSGLDGSVTGAGNPVPELLLAVYGHFLHGRLPAAEEAQAELDAWSDAHQALPLQEVAACKAGVAARVPGFGLSTRPPFSCAGDEETGALSAWLQGRLAAGTFKRLRKGVGI